MPPQDTFHVTVVFGCGHGDSLIRLDAALAYAQAQMDKLLSDHEQLEKADFDGIYCEREGAGQYWRFDYVDGTAIWVPLLDSATSFAARVGALRPGATLVARAADDLKDGSCNKRAGSSRSS